MKLQRSCVQTTVEARTVPTGGRPPGAAARTRRRAILRFAGIELAVWAVLYGVYLAVRSLTIGTTGDALANASEIGSFAGIRFNPYAAVPSMHVGWSLLVGIYGLRASSNRLLRGFFYVHPAVMVVAVTATGNHYFFDSLGGIAVALVALALVRRRQTIASWTSRAVLDRTPRLATGQA
jgi:hypothetical protein